MEALSPKTMLCNRMLDYGYGFWKGLGLRVQEGLYECNFLKFEGP